MPESEEEYTPLVDAAFENDLDQVRLLLEQGADVNERDGHDSTALHWACEHVNIEMVRILLKRGADVNIRDKSGDDAFYLAGDNGASEILKLLWDAGADKSRYPNYQP